ncbi:MAG: hypothetical protein LC781_02000 [Actinobacteria bacterium]|nr:hypothetical protein [Actinomycetota bacterium]
MLVHIVADYGQGDLAFAEVVQRIKLHLPDAEPVSTPVPSFSTLARSLSARRGGHRHRPTRVRIGEVEREACVSDGSLWIEFFLRGGSAWEEFSRLLVRAEVRIEAGA